MRHPSRLAALLLAALAAVMLWLWLQERRVSGQLMLEGAGAAAEKAKLQAEVAARVGEIESLRQQMMKEGIQPVVASPRAVPVPDESKRLEAVRSLTQAEQRISQLQAAVSEARERAGQLEAQVEKLAGENKQMEESLATLRDDLAGARRVVEVSEEEIRSKAARITQLETAARETRDTRPAEQKKLQDAAAAVRELTEIDRRRENTLQSLQRRFRDISDQYRAFALRLDTNRDNPAAAIPDVSRIQATVQAAEDEMRQLNALNVQARQAAQKVASATR